MGDLVPISETDVQCLHSSGWKPTALIGSGTYGQVFRCKSCSNPTLRVAAKVARREAAFRRCAITEYKVMRALLEVQCRETAQYIGHTEIDGKICIFSELLQRNLYEVLRESNFQPMPLETVRTVATSVLRCISYLHRMRLMHCDIKPANVMFRHLPDPSSGFPGEFCLIDFGAVRRECENRYYDVQSLWYRAPEVALGFPYSHLIDSWSVGCLLYELRVGRPLFYVRDENALMSAIGEEFGIPAPIVLSQGTRVDKFSEISYCTGHSLAPKLQKLLQNATGTPAAAQMESFVMLLRSLLCPNHQERLSCTNALNHPFIIGHRKPPCLPLSLAPHRASFSHPGSPPYVLPGPLQKQVALADGLNVVSWYSTGSDSMTSEGQSLSASDSRTPFGTWNVPGRTVARSPVRDECLAQQPPMRDES